VDETVLPTIVGFGLGKSWYPSKWRFREIVSRRHRRRQSLERAGDVSALRTRSVFLDESGFTGPDLLSSDQPWVSYAAVAIEPEEASSIVAEVTSRHRNLMQSGELKASTLLRSARGRDLALSLLKSITPMSRWVIHHKRYALAGNFVEYVFEPALSSRWSALVGSGFNRFVANQFFEGLVEIHKGGTLLERSFRSFMNGKDDGTFWLEIENAINDDSRSDSFRQIAFLARHFRGYAEAEIASVTARDYGKWQLDLSVTSLFGLLASFPSKQSIVYDVTCDHSKPLEALGDYYRGIRLPGLRMRRLGELRFAHSHETPGVQLADLLAGAAIYVQQERDGFEELAEAIVGAAGPFSVQPYQYGRYDEFNAELLGLFASYALNKLNVIEKFEVFIDRFITNAAAPTNDSRLVVRPSDL